MDGKRIWKQMAVVLTLGFLAGIFYANYAGKNYVSSTGIFHEYFLNEYVDAEIDLSEYLPYLIRWRGVPVLCFLIAGRLGLHRSSAVAVLLSVGFSGGVVLVAAVMRMGVSGIFFCMAALLPQMLFYASGWAVLLWEFYRGTEVRWSVGKSLFVFFLMTTGILTEAAWNPVVVEWALKLFR